MSKIKKPMLLDENVFATMALNNSEDAILVTDINHVLVWVNRGFERLFGHRREDALGKTPGSILDGPETDMALRAKMERALTAREKLTVEILHYHSDGTPLWVEKTLSPIFDESGTHSHNMSIARNITKRRELEERTREVMENEDHRQNERRLLSQISEWLYSAKSLEELLMVVKRSMQTLLPEADGQLFIYSNSRDTLDLMSHWGTEEPKRHIDAEDCWALRRGRAYAYGTKAIEFSCSHTHSEDIPYFCLPIIAHGASSPKAIKNAIRLADESVRRGVNDQIIENLHALSETAFLTAELKRGGRNLWTHIRDRFRHRDGQGTESPPVSHPSARADTPEFDTHRQPTPASHQRPNGHAGQDPTGSTDQTPGFARSHSGHTPDQKEEEHHK